MGIIIFFSCLPIIIEFQKVLCLDVLPLWLTNTSEGDPRVCVLGNLLELLLQYITLWNFLVRCPPIHLFYNDGYVIYLCQHLHDMMFYCHLSNGLFFSIAAVPLCSTVKILKKPVLVKHVEQL